MDTGNRLLLDVLTLVDELYSPARADTHTGKVGHPYVYPDPKMFKAATVATLKKKHTPCEVYRFLRAHRLVCQACGFDVRTRRELIEQGIDPDTDLPAKLQPLPCERTFRRRFPTLDRATRRQIQAWGQYLICHQQVTDATIVSVDKTMIKAQGPLWHKKDRQAGRIPDKLRNVDTDSQWATSHYRGWVQGYGLHVGVSATPGSPIVPFWADWTTNNLPEAKVALLMVPDLPPTTQTVDADTGYDDPFLRAAIQQRDAQGRLTRLLLVPIKVYASTPNDRKAYADLYQSEAGKATYHRRSVSIEPFYERLDLLFGIEPAWAIGLSKNRSWGLLWISTYQLLMIYLHRQGKPIEQMKQLLDQL